MVDTRKSIIEEAFMEAESIEKAFMANSKEILAHTMGSEIEQMVKESLEGSNGLKEDEDEEDVELELDMDMDMDMDMEMDSDVAGLDAGDDLEIGDDNDDEMEMDLDMDIEDDDMDSDDFEEIDLTDMDDETVISVFKKMAPEDEIEVVQKGDGVEIKDNATGAEYKIAFGGNSEMDMDMDMDMDDEEGEEGEEIEYQIELDDEDDDMEDEMDNMKEASRTNSFVTSGRVGNRKGSDMNTNRMSVRSESRTPRHLNTESPKFLKLTNENKVLKNKLNSVVSENETLREDYNKMVDALKEFRQKLNEVAVFNSNLTYTVRLFTEHSTTKNEKVDIIKRFDEAKTLKESKNIYKNLVKEVSKTKSPIRESIDNKLNETKSSSSSTQITESKIYVDPQIEKMKKLWSYNYKQ